MRVRRLLVSAGFLAFVGSMASVGFCQPEPNVPAKVADALRSDGIEVEGFVPQPLMHRDVATASRVIAIGVDLSAFLREEQASTELWNDVPPASVDYAASRTALLRHIDVLLDELQRGR